ncbi:MAG: hypothetical protein JEZ11_11215 [Desulfobacterales bacterium]|nr:hypothetical protein [Desulfobacterales bacterium]
MALKKAGTKKPRRVVIDASSAILLFKAGLLDLLTRVYRIVMTPSVLDETTRPGYPGARLVESLRSAGAIVILASKPADVDGLPTLGRGERDTIGAFLQGAADFVIIDDGKGAGFCRDHAIPYINALLVPRILVLSGQMSPRDGRKHTEAILAVGRYSPQIANYAATCPPEVLDFFLPSAPRIAAASRPPK